MSELYQKLTSAAQNGRPMGEHVQQCMTWRNRLKALGAELPHELFVQRLLEVDDEYMFMRASLVPMSPEQIVAALMEQYRLFQQRKQRRQARSAPAGLAARVHRLWPLSTEGESSAFATVVIYMHTMHAWLTVQMLWQMHGRTLQAVHVLIVCMGIFSGILK